MSSYTLPDESSNMWCIGAWNAIRKAYKVITGDESSVPKDRIIVTETPISPEDQHRFRLKPL